nr:serine:threonine protein phosphatase 4 [Hymenolepis microstoma]
MFSIPWIHIKPLILLKFNHIMDEFIDDVDENMHQNVLRSTDINDLRERVYKILSQFEGTPFTIQRICELLSDPRKHYSRPDKFLRGFEKVCLVVSTVDAYGNKIHNVEPRLSGTIERCTSFVLNGTSGESGPNEDSSGRSKRSEDGEEEDNEDLTSPRRPCINFYRRPTSKLVDGLHKSFGGDSLIGAYSPGIPGKHTLQRPFLSGRGSSAIPFSTIFEDAETSCTATTTGATKDDDSSNSGDDREEEMKQEKSECDGPISEEGKVPSTSESAQQQRPLTGIQKLFMENEEDDRDMLISPVPSIEQMLRPMGQLEAFVNTISMVTANPTSSLSHSTTSISESPLPKEPPPSPSSEDDEATSESEAKEVEIPTTEIKLLKNEESECKEKQKREAEEEETSLNTETEKDTARISPSSSVIRQPSLKRRDSDAPSEDKVVVSLASPAKRIRLGSEQEFTDIGFSESTLIPMDYGENENMQGVSTEQYACIEENSNESRFSSDYPQSSTASKEEGKVDQEAEASITTLLESRDEQEHPYATVDSDTGEKELLK